MALLLCMVDSFLNAHNVSMMVFAFAKAFHQALFSDCTAFYVQPFQTLFLGVVYLLTYIIIFTLLSCSM
jgi:hypothetical protein